MHMHDRDGITVWSEILDDFDNDGSIPLRVDALEAFLQSPFTVAYVGGGYIIYRPFSSVLG